MPKTSAVWQHFKLRKDMAKAVCQLLFCNFACHDGNMKKMKWLAAGTLSFCHNSAVYDKNNKNAHNIYLTHVGFKTQSVQLIASLLLTCFSSITKTCVLRHEVCCSRVFWLISYRMFLYTTAQNTFYEYVIINL